MCFKDFVKTFIKRKNDESKSNKSINIENEMATAASNNKKLVKIKQGDNNTNVVGDQTNIGVQNNIKSQTFNFPNAGGAKDNIQIKPEIDILFELIEIVKPIWIAHQEAGMVGCLNMEEFEDAKQKFELYENNERNIIKDSKIKNQERSLSEEFTKLCNLVHRYAECRSNGRIMITNDENNETNIQNANFVNQLKQTIKFVKDYKENN